MDWADYKILCDRPDFQSQWLIEQTLELVKEVGPEEIFEELASVLMAEPLPLPEGHKGSPDTLMYKLELSRVSRQQICEVVVAARKQNLTSSATAHRGLPGFEEAWTEYYEYKG